MVETFAVIAVANEFMTACALIVVCANQKWATCGKLVIEKILPLLKSIIQVVDIECFLCISEVFLQGVHRIDRRGACSAGIAALHAAAGVEHKLRHGILRSL